MAKASHIAAAAFALVLMSAPGSAQQAGEPLGSRFIALCKSPNATSQNTCGEVVTSIMNAHVEMSRQDPDQRVICPQRTLTIDEGRRVFVQWAEVTPNAGRLPFPDLVVEALLNRYPCSTYLKQPGRR